MATDRGELEWYIARLEHCLRRQIGRWRAIGGDEGEAALYEIVETLGETDADGAKALAANVLARVVDDILTMTGGSTLSHDRVPRRPFHSHWDVDSEDAFRTICEQGDELEFWCDLVGIAPDIVSIECAERMAKSPIGGLL